MSEEILHRCRECGYIYEYDTGNEIDFESNENVVCPICESTKEKFEVKED